MRIDRRRNRRRQPHQRPAAPCPLFPVPCSLPRSRLPAQQRQRIQPQHQPIRPAFSRVKQCRRHRRKRCRHRACPLPRQVPHKEEQANLHQQNPRQRRQPRGKRPHPENPHRPMRQRVVQQRIKRNRRRPLHLNQFRQRPHAVRLELVHLVLRHQLRMRPPQRRHRRHAHKHHHHRPRQPAFHGCPIHDSFTVVCGQATDETVPPVGCTTGIVGIKRFSSHGSRTNSSITITTTVTVNHSISPRSRYSFSGFCTAE